MHELSIVSSLIELCEENARANCAQNIEEVHVKIGCLSGVEPTLFKTCFESFKEQSLCKNAKLFMQISKLRIYCDVCKEEFELNENVFLCPKCKSSDIKVIAGEELYLMSLVMS